MIVSELPRRACCNASPKTRKLEATPFQRRLHSSWHVLLYVRMHMDSLELLACTGCFMSGNFPAQQAMSTTTRRRGGKQPSHGDKEPINAAEAWIMSSSWVNASCEAGARSASMIHHHQRHPDPW